MGELVTLTKAQRWEHKVMRQKLQKESLQRWPRASLRDLAVGIEMPPSFSGA